MSMISLRFSCKQCGLTDVLVSVKARDTAEEMNVIQWMQSPVAHGISMRHALLSPNCKAREMTFLKIPAPPEDGWVGMPTDVIPPEGEPSEVKPL